MADLSLYSGLIYTEPDTLVKSRAYLLCIYFEFLIALFHNVFDSENRQKVHKSILISNINMQIF